MATNTTNYNMVKPAYADTADIADINGNMDIIDGQMKTNADGVSANAASLGKTEAGLAVIVTGDTCPVSVPAGGYAYIKSNTHGLTEGLYRNKTGSAFPTSGGTADSTVFESVSRGGINALKSDIDTLNSKLSDYAKMVIGSAPANGSATLTLASSTSVLILVAGNSSVRMGAFIAKSNAGSTGSYILELATGSKISGTATSGTVVISNSDSAAAFIYAFVLEGSVAIS